MNELTYILGAGASFESIPLVKNFPRRFIFFAKSMERLSKHPYISIEEQNNAAKLYDHCSHFYKEIVAHQSFDTFFKKLFHIEQFDRIKLFKKVLNIYFLWESLAIEKGNSDEYDDRSPKDGDFLKSSLVDKRYDALIAGLLMPQKGKPEPYCNVNFITWNYDLNLFMSLKNYYLPRGTLGDFISQIDRGNGVWEIGNRFRIVNMNGYFYRSELNDLYKLENADVNGIIFKIISGSFFDDDFEDNDSNLISFAWERDNKSAKYARQLIVASDHIIVIGYTFPLYNRLVDLTYLKDIIFTKNKRLCIQDPNSEKIIDFSEAAFGFRNISTSGRPIKECDSFFVPSDIFKDQIISPIGV